MSMTCTSLVCYLPLQHHTINVHKRPYLPCLLHVTTASCNQCPPTSYYSQHTSPSLCKVPSSHADHFASLTSSPSSYMSTSLSKRSRSRDCSFNFSIRPLMNWRKCWKWSSFSRNSCKLGRDFKKLGEEKEKGEQRRKGGRRGRKGKAEEGKSTSRKARSKEDTRRQV